MNHWQKIRHEASRLREEICADSDLNPHELFPAKDFVEKAADCLGIFLLPEHPESANLRRALAVLEDDVVFFNNELPAWFKSYCIAHELGHFRLHRHSVHCSADDIENFATDEASAAETVVGYGAGERREREANLFALELLLPGKALRRMFREENLTASEIARKVGLPPEMVWTQLTHALLTPEIENAGEVVSAKKSFDLDDSQRRAAKAENCPLLITAGPGTGKTQTLVNRILFLLEQGVLPERILALTFSNKATEEMRERIAALRPADAVRLPVMTFHSFGLDILRRFWREAGLEHDSKLLDPIDALLFLESNLAKLNLKQYQNLIEPTFYLPAILTQISRAKDELVTPERYAELAAKQAASAQIAEEKQRAAKAQEVAVYAFYQKHLEIEKLLDFGDLIFRAVRLLQEDAAVRVQLRGAYDAILVDEFQDVNRASGVLLREIACDGKGLWAVGDLRQSIYRWRGASPTNLRHFAEDFPSGATLSLENNYRSATEIIELFSHYAKQMKAAGAEVFNDWRANRNDMAEGATRLILEIADDLPSEAANLAKNVVRYKAAGVRYKEQAVICRSHSQLTKFAEALTERGIPVLYLGDLFEREEIRDLLSLLDLKSSQTGYSLVRVACFPEYGIPPQDVKLILERANVEGITFADILSDENIEGELSEAGRTGWLKLKGHLTEFESGISAWRALSRYLFDGSRYLQPILSVRNVQSEQRLLAIYQFLRFAQNQEKRFVSEGAWQIQAFLRYAKKLAYFGEDKIFNQIPAAAENLDAVRLLTVHAAKGLEFPVVYLPHLGTRYFPQSRKPEFCHAPEGMIEGAADFHEEEEECLFFVAMSRSKDFLHLSRATSYTSDGKNSNPSKFLEQLKNLLPEPRFAETQIPKPIEKTTSKIDFAANRFYVSQLDRYLRCPRQFYYAEVWKMSGKRDDSIYLKFHSCVYQTINDLQRAKNAAILFDERAALEKLDEYWKENDLDTHAYAPVYRAEAEEMLRRMCRQVSETEGEFLHPTWEVELENGAIVVRPDNVEMIKNETETRVVVRRFRTGKAPNKIEVKEIDGLLQYAVKTHYPEAAPVMQKKYLGDGVTHDLPFDDKKINNRLKKYNDAIEQIQNGEFSPKPNSDNCPGCPYFFICPK
jgi:DNA helicase II / ATP-dependent DNA helicase PcrA